MSECHDSHLPVIITAPRGNSHSRSHELPEALEQTGHLARLPANKASELIRELSNVMPQEERDELDRNEDDDLDDEEGAGQLIDEVRSAAPLTAVRRARGLDL